MNFIKGFILNLQFFTVIPIKIKLSMEQEVVKRAVQVFPLIGLFQGILYSAFFYVLQEWTPFSHLAVAFFLSLVMILLTGGIHLDGWMDTSDAYFSYRDQQKRLEIMKDPRVGAFGVMSIIVLLSCRFLFIYESTMDTQPITYIFIAAIPFLSKSMMGVLLLTVKSAKNEGLASFFQRAASPLNLWIYPVYILAFFILGYKKFLLEGVLIIMAAGCVFFWRRKAVKWFGGITGDVVGASVEGTELMLWMTVWLLHYFVMA